MTRIKFLNVPVDLLTMVETVALAEQAMAQRSRMRHVALNVAKLIRLAEDPELAHDVRESDIVGIDGMGIILALRLFGVRNIERVAGCDLMFALLEHCAEAGRKPYILGARHDVLVRAVHEARRRWPDLIFAGWRDGYFTYEEESGIVEAIGATGADCLFVAMPTPQKERFLSRHARELNVPFVMGVGGSVDVLAGRVSRAPHWMQRSGLEWLHRLVQEPAKMLPRYAVSNARFAVLIAKLVVTRNNPVLCEKS